MTEKKPQKRQKDRVRQTKRLWIYSTNLLKLFFEHYLAQLICRTTLKISECVCPLKEVV